MIVFVVHLLIWQIRLCLYLQLLLNMCRSDGLLAFVNNFLKEHFLPAIFVDYRKCVQQAISSKSLTVDQYIVKCDHIYVHGYMK